MNLMAEAKALEIRANVSDAEWALRVDLAAAYRLLALYRWDDLVFTHVSARIPGPEHHFLINPYGAMFEEITASSLVKIDLQGNAVMNSPFSINPAGFVIHSAIHAAREDAQCVMHTHTAAGIAVSAQRAGLLPISQQSIFPLSALGYHDYEGVALTDDEKPRLVRDLGDKLYLILRNHGLLTVGSTIPDAFLAMYTLQRACEIQVAAQGAGAELIPVPQSIVGSADAFREVGTRGLGGGLAWPGLLRKLDRTDPSYAS